MVFDGAVVLEPASRVVSDGAEIIVIDGAPVVDIAVVFDEAIVFDEAAIIEDVAGVY